MECFAFLFTVSKPLVGTIFTNEFVIFRLESCWDYGALYQDSLCLVSCSNIIYFCMYSKSSSPWVALPPKELEDTVWQCVCGWNCPSLGLESCWDLVVLYGWLTFVFFFSGFEKILSAPSFNTEGYQFSRF